MGKGAGDCAREGLSVTTLLRQNATSTPLTTKDLLDVLPISQEPSQYATINQSRITTLTAELSRREEFMTFRPYAWDDETFWNASDTPQNRSQFFAIGNAINFRFWEIEHENGTPVVHPSIGIIDGQEFKGSMYMWRALRRTLEQNELPLLSAGFLANLNEKEFHQIFADDNDYNPLAVGADERIANLRDLGQQLRDNWDGQFLNLATMADGSLVEFSRLSRGIRAFNDPVHKLTMVNAILHSGSGVSQFRDEPLAAIDYHLLKQALRQGLVEPSEELQQKLIARELMTSEESDELRRITLLAFTELSQRLGISGEVMDNKYWLNRNVCADPEPHCADCVFAAACQKKTQYQMPVEITRYY